MASCNVRGCTNPATEFFIDQRITGARTENLVCQVHSLELQISQYATTKDGRELLVGADAPPSIVNMIFTGTVGGSQVTLVLGHDGIEENRVTFLMSPDDSKAISEWVTGAP
jgi:hypothetical protein